MASYTRPTVSIGMPVFNGERFIEQALDSLLQQTFTDLEIVIADNASTDRTESICRSYAERDERVRYIRNRTNYGLHFNFNNVFRLSSGRFFKWMASDDVCGRDYLLRAVEVLEQDPDVVVAWGRTRGIDEGGNVVDVVTEFSDLNAPGSTYSPQPTDRFRRLMDDIWWADGPFHGVIRSDVLSETQLHPAHPSGDKVLLAELCLRGRFYEIDEDLFYKRVKPDKRATRSKGQVRQYTQRLTLFGGAISRAPITRSEKVRCYAIVVRQVLTWLKLRGSQVVSGTNPWARSRRQRKVA